MSNQLAEVAWDRLHAKGDPFSVYAVIDANLLGIIHERDDDCGQKSAKDSFIGRLHDSPTVSSESTGRSFRKSKS